MCDVVICMFLKWKDNHCFYELLGEDVISLHLWSEKTITSFILLVNGNFILGDTRYTMDGSHIPTIRIPFQWIFYMKCKRKIGLCTISQWTSCIAYYANFTFLRAYIFPDFSTARATMRNKVYKETQILWMRNAK